MTFENALREIKEDSKAGMRLPYWTSEAVVKVARESSVSPYLYIKNRFGEVPWIPTYPDIFSNQWEVTGI